jgi:hypothetical protein
MGNWILEVCSGVVPPSFQLVCKLSEANCWGQAPLSPQPSSTLTVVRRFVSTLRYLSSDVSTGLVLPQIWRLNRNLAEPVTVGFINKDHSVRFQVITATSMKMVVFWDVTPCSLLEGYRRFSGDGGNTHLWNVGQFLPDKMAHHLRRQSSSNNTVDYQWPDRLPGWSEFDSSFLFAVAFR